MKYFIKNNTIKLYDNNSIDIEQAYNPVTQIAFKSDEDCIKWAMNFIEEVYNYKFININMELYNESLEKVNSLIEGEMSTIKLIDTSGKLNGTYKISVLDKNTEQITIMSFKFVDGIAEKKYSFENNTNIEILLNNVFIIGIHNYIAMYEDSKYTFKVIE